jgi:ribose transport system permease protein
MNEALMPNMLGQSPAPAEAESSDAPPAWVRLGARALRDAQFVGPLALLIAMIIAFSIAAPAFLTLHNLTSVIQQNSDIAILGIGLTIVILLGEIDLSFPGFVLVTGALTGLVFGGSKIPVPLFGPVSFGSGSAFVGAALGVLAALVLGLLNGFVIGWFKVPSFIGSLGLLLLSQGLGYYWLNGQSTYNFPSWMLSLGQGSTAGIPNLAILAAGVAVLVHLMLSRTIVGRFVYMTGASRTAARLSGINTRRLTIVVYAVAGVIAGIGGLAYAGNLASINGTSGGELLLPTFAAVVLGGNSLLGGSGGVKNTVVGVLLFSVLANGLLLMNIDIFFRPLAEGALLVVAVVLNVGLSKLAAYANSRSFTELPRTALRWRR